MADKKITDNPRITDTIVFELQTPDANGCFEANPYKIDNITIYYVERDFLGTNWGEYEKVKYRDDLVALAVVADKKACEDPTLENVANAQQVHNELESTAQRNTYYFKDAVVVHKIGTPTEPVWLSTDTDHAFITLIPEDEDGNPQYGHFEYRWNPEGRIREGDFFICWTWTPHPAGETLSAHQSFSIFGDPRAVITIPTHLTADQKYETLLERYLPEMYKQYISDADLTPEMTDKLNQAIALGFTTLEDLANQLIDLFDANAIHESLLVYLSNLFNLRLKSGDPTLWRRQIKEAIPLFKKKGTLGGLKEAFAQAGMKLNKMTRLWQVVSPYTWQESFKVKDSPTFVLAKTIVEPLNPQNFGLWLRREGEDEYVEVSADNVMFEDTTCEFSTKMTWVGDEKSVNGVSLFEGDIIRVLYQYAPVPAGRQPVENYIRQLTLADTRDEFDQNYPLKNWNVRLIEEDDPLFDLIVSNRHPFREKLVFGQVRTEFPFSENIYNMEEYNGSTRDSNDPCFIDKNFLDPCGACVSSKYNIDVGVENLTDDRIAEIRDILKEYTPFHAVPHMINFEGEINEYVLSPVEEIEVLISFNKSEVVLSGDANPFFIRFIEDGLTVSKVTRDELATQLEVVGTQTGTLYNEYVGLVALEENLEHLGLDLSSHELEVLAPSPNAGTYTLTSLSNNHARLASTAVEPLNQSMFTFRLSNINYTTSVAIITQDDVFKLSDNSVSYVSLGVKTLWDVDNTPNYNGDTWRVLIPAYSATPYDILNIDPSGNLLLYDPDRTLPTSNTSSIVYTLLSDEGATIEVSSTGALVIDRRGRVDLNDSGIEDIAEFVSHGDYLLYDDVEYLVTGLVNGEFYIAGYGLGDATGVNVTVKRELLKQAIGFFGYSGLKLNTTTDYEADLEIMNGANPPVSDPNDITENNLYKENFLVQINNRDYYRMQDIDGTTITLAGLPYDATTLGAGGELVSFKIARFVKDTVEVRFMVFDQLDRRGKDPVVREIFSTVTNDVAVFALSMPQGSDFGDNVVQDEEVGFSIEYKDGSTSTGVL
jgi:hypothetical protein